MRDKDASRALLLDDVLQHGFRDRLSVVRRRPTTEFVEDDERTRSGETEDLGRLGELDHEGRPAASHLILGAHAAEEQKSVPTKAEGKEWD